MKNRNKQPLASNEIGKLTGAEYSSGTENSSFSMETEGSETVNDTSSNFTSSQAKVGENFVTESSGDSRPFTVKNPDLAKDTLEAVDNLADAFGRGANREEGYDNADAESFPDSEIANRAALAVGLAKAAGIEYNPQHLLPEDTEEAA